GRVMDMVDAEARTARVDVLGTPRVINLGLLEGVGVGDWVLVYMGCALERIGEAEAAEAVRLWEELCTSFPSR
ncbi:MAG TPA: HypC/HybG/HupF family hydrogenase formation chaperone, partial [bacterium]|nr:HypC/HybG/HupF family hydrogenase formation chaperone [bacterium]